MVSVVESNLGQLASLNETITASFRDTGWFPRNNECLLAYKHPPASMRPSQRVLVAR